ncbi:MAG TPA: tRNA uridine-5-carboxymethylaminomethyl(34) synthesis GTPase MnmE [Bacteroidetes bacterium]|nr:tRNA uridine-5-carboxymethylaminomethyl(34) synthesis GTPase MnmE [Bacteroidota bacterium]
MKSSESNSYNPDTICAVATPPGMGAIAIVRISGQKSLEIVLKCFVSKNSKLSPENIQSHHLYFGEILNEGKVLDEVLVSYFKAPHSYTGEDAVEISCHGSEYIQQMLLQTIIESGARMARPGEFTLRAFLNGKMDLSQAEAVADLIVSESKAAHRMAIRQMRGGFSEKIAELRKKLVDFASLLELELDFGEEDVEFADRSRFTQLLEETKKELIRLKESFKMGNVLKKGIPVAIIGKPNVGKSTLLNAILNEEKAIVSEVPGTTRDAIEDTIALEGYSFRFIDTAGLRDSTDVVENMGIEKTYDKINLASLILYVCDISSMNKESIKEVLEEFKTYIHNKNKHFILVANKIDQLAEIPGHLKELLELETVFVSAKRKENIHLLAETLVNHVKNDSPGDDILVNNSRHFEALAHALESIIEIEKGFKNNIPTDLVAIDVRQALYHLGSITGEVTSDEILGNIFGKFCIGK